MIVEYVRYRVAPDRAAELEDAYRRAAPILEASPHCVRFELASCTEDAGAVVVRIEWDSAEGHLGGFRRSAAFGEFVRIVRPFVESIDEMRHYDVKLAGGATAA